MIADALEPWHAVEPTGLAAAILTVTIVFTILCLAVVGLRIWIRMTTHCFGHEDWLMGVGTVSLLPKRLVRGVSRDTDLVL